MLASGADEGRARVQDIGPALDPQVGEAGQLDDETVEFYGFGEHLAEFGVVFDEQEIVHCLP